MNEIESLLYSLISEVEMELDDGDGGGEPKRKRLKMESVNELNASSSVYYQSSSTGTANGQSEVNMTDETGNSGGILFQFVKKCQNYEMLLNKDSFVQNVKCVDLLSDDRSMLSSCSSSSSLTDSPSKLANKKNDKLSATNGESVNVWQQITMCRDCVLSRNQASNDSNGFCRFIGWRKLKKTNQVGNSLKFIGFLDVNDATKDDTDIWDLNENSIDANESSNVDKYAKILLIIRQHFKRLIDYEIKMRESYKSTLVWKRQILHMRELCDQCNTSIFNGHFVCLKCGFSVCLSCYELRLKEFYLNNGTKPDKDRMNWFYCLSGQNASKKHKVEHKPEEMVYAQYIIPHVINSVYGELNKFLDNFDESKLGSNLDDKKLTNPICKYSGDFFNKFLTLDCTKLSEREKEDHPAEQDDKIPPNNEALEQLLGELFETEWFTRKPILIKNLHKNLNQQMWRPASFAEQFSELKVDLINCKNGRVLNDVEMSKFWLGFEDENSRMRDHKNTPMILKLKDWPTSEDFKTILPDRFNDLMSNLPVRDYTHRNGVFNLVHFLPETFCLPDLGPKLYVAYSSASTPQDGTTNLHVDISDAVNLMIYASPIQPTSTSKKSSKKVDESNVLELLKKSNCSKDQINRYLKGEIPGALWHIFKPEDADKIRTFFAVCKLEKNKKIKNEYDPIHDQINYIDDKMLARLNDELDVKVFTIIQYLGDAIFIPAGAPHQVRNINNCIKVALDFVTPQGVDQCLLITNQFRDLSERHSNREDKLQIKNIIYHTVKKCLSVMKKFSTY